MKDAIDRIKSVLATKDFGAHLNHYLFEPGWVLCSDGRMVAAVTTDEQFSCLVPGPELEAILNRFDEDVKVEFFEGDRPDPTALPLTLLQLSAGRLRGSIKTLPTDVVTFFRPEHEWLDPPPGLVAALKKARPFIAETSVKPWGLCAHLFNGFVTATNNISIIRVDCPGLVPEREVLLPSWAVDFVIKVNDELTGVMWNTNYAAFKWESGVWFRTQLVDDKFPEQIAKILSAPERATILIEDDWRDEYMSVAGLSENIVTLSPSEISGGHGKAAVRAEIATPVNGTVIFNPKFLSPVIAAADYWAPDIYPAPVPFRGDGFSGVVIGRKA